MGSHHLITYLLLVICYLMILTHSSYGITVRVPEDANVGYSIYTMPLPSNGELYSIYQEPSAVEALKLFELSAAGQLRVKKNLNRQQQFNQRQFNLVVLLRRISQTSGGTATPLTIVITDSNDHKPVFSQNQYEGYITENQPISTMVKGLINAYATDNDTSIDNYKIIQGDDQNHFAARVNRIHGIAFLTLTTRAVLNREEQSTYQLTIRAQDTGKPPRSATAIVHLVVLDINDMRPTFTSQNYTFNVDENIPVMSSIGSVTAYDNDDDYNGQIYYYPELPLNDFMLDYRTGAITLLTPLNYQRRRRYQFRINAVDRGQPSFKAIPTQVIIHINDVTNYPSTLTSSGNNTIDESKPPQFTQSTYYSNLDVDLPPHSVILVARAFDSYAGSSNDRLIYSMIAAGSQSNIWTIDRNTGAIRLVGELQVRRYTFQVQARDRLLPRRASIADVNIQVYHQNLNKNQPQFTQPIYSAVIKEDTALDTSVLKVTARDQDNNEDGQITYSILSATPYFGYFTIESNTGIVRTTRILDYEFTTQYWLTIQARDGGTPSRSTTCRTIVQIVDVDDNTPQFEQVVYNTSLPESLPPNSFVTVVRAIDIDSPSNAIVTYSLDPSTITNPPTFSISANDGIVRTLRPLDRELRSYYELRVITSAQTSTLLTIRVVDINDNMPEFTSSNYFIEVPENMGYNPNLLCIHAVDHDEGDNARIIYSITGGNSDGLFSIHPQTGLLSAQNLNYEQRSSYLLIVRAVDHGTPRRSTSVQVDIQVTDKSDPPYFDQSYYQANLPDDAGISQVVITIPARSEQSSVLRYSLVDPDPSTDATLQIDPSTAQISVKNNDQLDYRRRQLYEFRIRALDIATALSATVPVIVRIEDANNHYPIFSQSPYWITLNARSSPQQTPLYTVMQLRATDEDQGSHGQITYSFPDPSKPPYPGFQVNATTGEVTSRYGLNHSKTPLSFSVLARDHGSTPKTSSVTIFLTIIPLSQKLIRFNRTLYQIAVGEDMVPKNNFFNDIQALNPSGNSNGITYSIVGGNFGNTFRINTQTASLSLVKELDFEKHHQYNLVIRAKYLPDPSQTSYIMTANVNFRVDVLDRNDAVPQFIGQIPHEVRIEQNWPSGTFVSQVQAYDRDMGTNGIIRYSSRDHLDKFHVNATTGIITTAKILSGINVPADGYFLNVIASDSGVPPRSTVILVKIQINTETTLSFSRPSYTATISENSPIGYLIKEFDVISKQKTPQFSFLPSAYQSYFCIDQRMRVTLQRRLDLEQIAQDQLVITMQGRLGYTTARASVMVTLRDVNDHPPEFSQTSYYTKIGEDAPVGTTLIQMNATDPDHGNNGQITYSIDSFGSPQSNSYFAIDPKTAVIRTRRSLDYEQQRHHSITIRAVDGGTPSRQSLARVQVAVDDRNDNKPQFVADTPKFCFISVTVHVGTVIARLTATDPDDGANGRVTYSLVEDASKEGRFDVDSITGDIKVVKPLNRIDFQYGLTIRATDGGTTPKYDEVTLFIGINFPPVTPPYFVQANFLGYVRENMLANTEVVQTRALSNDRIRYQIVSGDTSDAFAINSGNGWITTRKPLDYEKENTFDLIVRATDISGRDSDIKVTISVTDENEYTPLFNHLQYGELPSEVDIGIPIGSTIMQLQAIDYDNSSENTINYQIDTNSAKEHFAINSRTGVITNLKLMRGVLSPYRFQVSAIDNGKPSKRSQATACVIIINLPPSNQAQQVAVRENSPIDTTVTKLTTTLTNPYFIIAFPNITQFKINPRTGLITVGATIDREANMKYKLITQVSPITSGIDFTTRIVEVTVIDFNDNKPIFTMPAPYEATVNENAVVGTSVYRLRASDADEGSNSLVEYQLDPSSSGPFSVNPVTGVITTTGAKLQLGQRIQLVVRAVDKGNPPQTSDDAVILVRVENRPPQFTQSRYRATVAESQLRNLPILTVRAISFSGRGIIYSILNGNVNSRFTINADTGLITAPFGLDYENDQHDYTLTIRATESEANPLSSQVQATITITDSNDCTPQFTKTEYEPSQAIPETASVGTQVVQVSATDCDSGTSGQLRYSIQSEYFKIDEVSGAVEISKQLNYENKQVYSFIVTVQDLGTPSRSSQARVTIPVIDTNDEAPKFSLENYRFSVDENAPGGETVATVIAFDLDSKVITYTIIGGNTEGNFVIDSVSGVIRLRSNPNPNFRQRSYSLRVAASDSRLTGYTNVIIDINDINDHKPVFTQCNTYAPTIAEHQPSGSTVLTVTASDDDEGSFGLISYSLVLDANQPKHFNIDAKTGAITTNREFDRERQSLYSITVRATDGGNNSSLSEVMSGFCTFNVRVTDINDNSPSFEFKQYFGSVLLNVPINTRIITLVASDNDTGNSGAVTYSLDQSDDALYFQIDPTNGILSTARSLDGNKREYRFLAVAIDNGQPPLQSVAPVVIQVQTNNAARFTQDRYQAQIVESANVGTIVATVNAYMAGDDSNAWIATYALEPGNLPKTNNPPKFSINIITGQIGVTDSLDYEVTPQFELKVIGRLDNGNQQVTTFSTVIIQIIDVNDNPPRFTLALYSQYVRENTPVGTPLEGNQIKAIDRDGNSSTLIIYSLVEDIPASRGKFLINARTGQIRTAVVFDRESSLRYYTVIVKATDNGKPPQSSTSSVRVQILDVNDSPPRFAEQYYTATVAENVETGYVVTTVTATDEDSSENTKLSYFFIKGNHDSRFAVDNNGRITVEKCLNYEKETSYSLTLQAFDGRFYGTTIVNISVTDVNDNRPQFTKFSYTARIKEDTPIGTTLFNIYATDPDKTVGNLLTYSLRGQGITDVDPPLFIVEQTGVVKTNAQLDRETKDVYEFSCVATDNGEPQLSSFADCRVYLDDVNDERPYFPDQPYIGYALENAPPPVNVRPVTALDNDIGNNSRFIYSLVDDADGTFTIDADNGMIKTQRQLDREAVANYTVIVRATDRGQPPLSGQVNVLIQVTDSNDHSPHFKTSMFSANISEHAPLGFPILRLEASDNDIGSNGALLYSIISGNTPVQFAVDAESGLLTVSENKLDYESKQFYNLTVMVQDRGVPTLKDTAYIEIYIGDFNDIPPRFTNPTSQNITISEAARPGLFVTQVIASDPEQGRNGELFYSIVAGDPIQSFAIDPLTGVITVRLPLDRESKLIPDHYYTLTVRATDRGQPPLYSEIPVYVYLDDVNDNGPVFIPLRYHGKIMENRKKTQNVTQLKAIDPDSANNGAPFTFTLLGSDNDTRHFTLDSRTGVLQTVDRLFDREKKSQYRLTVRATDSGIPPMSAVTQVLVTVMDENDNQHRTGIVNIDIVGYNDKFNGGNVGYVYSPDPDDDRNQKNYSIISGNEERWFSINRTNGMIYCRPGLPMNKEFRLSVRVSDGKFADVTSSVVIKSESRSTDALINIASIQAAGINPNDFVSYYYESFRKAVANILRTTTPIIVDIINVQAANPSQSTAQAIDIMFAAHGSPYYAKDVIESRLMMQKASLEEQTGLYINQIGVDACQTNNCLSGCRTNVTTNNSINFVSPGSKSFTGVDVVVKPVCYQCNFIPVLQNCQANHLPCLHNGKCQQSLTAGAICQCLPGYDGQYCQWRTRSFQGNSYFWLRSLPKCNQLTLEMEFTTTNSEGLLLYTGPVSGSNGNFLAIELIGGRIEVIFSVSTSSNSAASGTLVVANGNLNDGRWHKVKFQYDGKILSVVVDDCLKAPLIDVNGTLAQDRSKCSASRILPVAARYIAGNAPVQLGGLYIDAYIVQNKNLRVPSYQGCIRNFKVNGELQDLDNPLRESRTSRYCSSTAECSSSCNNNGKCVRSWSRSICECNLGYSGDSCQIKTVSARIPNNTRGYIRYDISQLWTVTYSKFEFKVITRDRSNSLLLFVDTGSSNSLEMIQMVNGSIRYIVQLPSYPAQSTTIDVACDQGTWCLITAERIGNVASLKVNNKIKYFQLSDASQDQLLIISGSERYQLYFGGVPERFNIRTNSSENFMGCVDDFRYNGRTILANQSVSGVTQDFVDSIYLGCRSMGCIRKSVCPSNLYCDDLWDAHRCIDICRTRNPCQNNGTCNIANSQFQCSCHHGHFGPECQFGGPAAQMQEILTYSGIGGGAILAFLCILIICLIIQSRNKRKIREKLEYAKKGSANIATYRIEGGGEDDVDNYDLNILKNPLPDSISSLPVKIPLSPSNSSKRSYSYNLRQMSNGSVVIKNGLPSSKSIDPDELMKRYVRDDSVKYYADEGKSTPAGSLSSLEVIEDDEVMEDDQASFSYLNVWGPRFKHLADIYNTPSVEDIPSKSENV
ncbi:Protocadherin-like protein [Trichoplax sp. H2]|nr:Protocadherin-like protein [Trichoplax sp. H2]|eukprot:RDD47003.1 Protocadherin-like protein [Trichoplax sp. H2]